MKINATEIRVGMILEYKDDLWEVLKTNHVKPGKGGAFAQVEMKSLNKSTKLNERFRSSETVEKASLEEIKYNFLYKDETDYFFMNPVSFEQINLNKSIKLDHNNGYFDSLGINTIWISPLVDQAKGAWGLWKSPRSKFSAYHGYWPTSFLRLNPAFGTKEDLLSCIALSHQKNINVVPIEFMKHFKK